jgi:hypothetical protein
LVGGASTVKRRCNRTTNDVDVVELNSWTGMHILIVTTSYSGRVYLTFIYSTAIGHAYSLCIPIA